MIPVYTPLTGHKPKLPRSFAWVVTTQLLSEYFAEAPQKDSLQVWYDDRPMDYKLRLDQIVSKQIPYQIFTVWYVTSGEPHWFFMVYPVESSKRSQIRDLLISTTFPKVFTWLKEQATNAMLFDDKHLRCIYNPAESSITIKEELPTNRWS